MMMHPPLPLRGLVQTRYKTLWVGYRPDPRTHDPRLIVARADPYSTPPADTARLFTTPELEGLRERAEQAKVSPFAALTASLCLIGEGFPSLEIPTAIFGSSRNVWRVVELAEETADAVRSASHFTEAMGTPPTP